MITFTLVAGLITLITLGLLLLPLRSARSPVSYERQEQNIHFAKQRIQELDEQLAADTISTEEHEALKLEIESTLADDISHNHSKLKPQSLSEKLMHNRTDRSNSNNKHLITGLCVILPLMAIGIYALLGTPNAIKPNLSSNANKPQQPLNQQQVEEMIVTIEERLKTHPNDPQGWAILSRSYLALGRYEDAEQSLLKEIELTGESANLYAQLADTSSLITQGQINEKSIGYVNKALELDAQQPQALWLAGLHAAQTGQPEQARSFWNRLIPLLASAPKQQQDLQTIIDQTLVSSPTQSTANVTAQTKPSAQQVVQQVPIPDSQEEPINLNLQANLTIAVKLSSELTNKVEPNDVVFVFARASGGVPAPVAAKRLQVKDLPTEISLSDADAMLPQFKLSLFENVQLVARVSKSGNPTAQAGDLQSEPLKTKNSETKKLELIITEVVN